MREVDRARLESGVLVPDGAMADDWGALPVWLFGRAEGRGAELEEMLDCKTSLARPRAGGARLYRNVYPESDAARIDTSERRMSVAIQEERKRL